MKGTYEALLISNNFFQKIYFLVFISHVIKAKNRNYSINKVKNLGYNLDDCHIHVNNLANNQVSAFFHLCIICRSVSPKFIGLCMQMPCLCPSEGHKHGDHKVTETSAIGFCY